MVKIIKRFIVVDDKENVCLWMNASSYDEALAEFDSWLLINHPSTQRVYVLLEVNCLRSVTFG